MLDTNHTQMDDSHVDNHNWMEYDDPGENLYLVTNGVITCTTQRSEVEIFNDHQNIQQQFRELPKQPRA